VDQSSVNLAFLGDVMVGRGFVLTDASLSYLEPSLNAADLALANLESPLTEASSDLTQAYVLCAAPENAGFLAQSGLDFVSIVNNHSLDCGLEGARENRIVLESAGLVTIDSTGTTTTIHDIQLTFFAFEDISRPLDLESAVSQVEAACREGSLVIVSMHWGAEYQAGISKRQQHIAERLASAGASLIWGHHPHVLQPMEWIPRSCSVPGDRTGCTLVLYSLGNAIFDQGGLSDTRRSALVILGLDHNGIKSIQVTPFVFDPVTSRLEAPDKTETDLIRSRLKPP
jgi:poly-gamma-glutamate capsule biosynthesis protein CapA/YwtB (metallophosphatase superfamily)